MNLENIRSSYHCRDILTKNKKILLGLFPLGNQVIEFDLFFMYKLRLYINHKLKLIDVIERMSNVKFAMGVGNSGLHKGVEYHCMEIVAKVTKDDLQTSIGMLQKSEMIVDSQDMSTKMMPILYFQRMWLPQSGPTAAGPKRIH